MKKPRLCLAISASIALLQANCFLQQVGAEPTSVKNNSVNVAKDKSLLATNNGASSAPLNQAGLAKQHKQIAAQLGPDQIVAQADQTGGAGITPIPPVVSGTLDLEEFKPTNTIDVKVSQSRTFKIKNKILRTSISDPSIAEPVVVAENQIVILGKSPGGATLVLWDDAGNSVAVDIKVSRDYSRLQTLLRQVDPRIIVQPFNVGGSDKVILRGDVDHAESVIRAFGIADAFMDDRGMTIQAANSRLIDPRIGEMQRQGGMQQQGGQTGKLAAISQVDRYTYFSNLNNNIGRAQAIISEGGRVASIIRVRKTPLIVLHCTFMEVNTAAVRELGVQLGLNFTSQSFTFGLGGQNLTGNTSNTGPGFYLQSTPGVNGTTGSAASPFAAGAVNSAVALQPGASGAQQVFGYVQQGMAKSNSYGATTGPVQFLSTSTIPSVVNGQLIYSPLTAIGQGMPNSAPTGLLSQAYLFGAPGGAGFTQAGLPNAFTGTSNFNSGNASRWSLNPTIQGVITHSRARILAEPTLVTISGERASFLAGGEIPIPQQTATAGTSLGSVGFEPFGLRLNMIPVLLENGTINLEVSPEERLISTQETFQAPGTQGQGVPGFTTRKAQTIVEMKPGQELFISGLIASNSGREIDKTPIIGEIPVLGALYRSKAFAKNESELVVAVRPEVILPGQPGQMKMPEEISKVEGPRDMNMFQVEPTVIDERYMTSGQADRSMKLPGTLPIGAPVPDNQ